MVSVHHYFKLGCPDPAPVRADRFAALLDDLLESGIAAEPVWVLSGPASPTAFSLGTLVMRASQDEAIPQRLTDDDGTNLAVRYAGTDRNAIHEAVLAAPFGVEIVAAYFYVKDPGRPRSQSELCDAALHATIEPSWLLRTESFVVGEELTLWGSYDPDEWFADPDEWQPPVLREFGYPLGKARPGAEALDIDSMSGEAAAAALGFPAAKTRWYLSVEGKGAWNLAGPAFPVCARHFGAPPLAGYDTA